MKMLIGLLVLTSQFAFAEDTANWPKVVMPTGQIPAGAKVEAAALPTGDSIVATPEANRPLAVKANSQLLRVTAIESDQIDSADKADIAAQVNSGNLRVAAEDLATNAVCSSTTAGTQSCQTTAAIPLSVTSPTNPNYVYPALAAPTTVAVPLTTAGTASGDSSGLASLIASMTASMGQSQGAGSSLSTGSGGGSSALECDTSSSSGSGRTRASVSMLQSSYVPTAGDLKNEINGKPPECGLKQAQAAYESAKASGKVTNDIMIVNDFKTGAAKGKMYFVHADGSMATNVGVPNPIEVARGDGGFGNGGGSGRTPNGAIYTGAYRPPRGGNVKDGIDLYGLEPGNKDITGRGVLLHGWNPNSVTHGCLGIPGTLTTGRGRANFGNYLDILKTGLLRNGGVMIYNFTPAKAAQCSN